MTRMLPAVVTGLVVCLSASGAQSTEIRVRVDWESFLSRHDLVWTVAPTRGYADSPFVGNGALGAMIRQEGEDSLRLDVARTDVHERIPADVETSQLARIGRLPVGAFILKSPAPLDRWDVRQDLYRAEVRGKAGAGGAAIPFRLLAHATEPVMIFEWKAAGAELEWVPAEPAVARGKPPRDFINAPGTGSKEGAINVFLQVRKGGGDYATAWQVVKLSDGTQRLFISIIDSFPDPGAAPRAVAAVRAAVSADFDELLTKHRAWWAAYYPHSFVSVPYEEMESFYWIQVYKVGSAIRRGGPLFDLMGPWYHPSRWGASWWNMNNQMLYCAFPPANRMELAWNLSDNLQRNVRNLVASAPRKYQHDSALLGRATGQDLRSTETPHEYGNLTWVCHNLWLHYRVTMDKAFLKERVYPVLRRATALYLHLLAKDENGVYHLPVGSSPESHRGPDCNFELSCIRWGCRTLLNITDILEIKDEMRGRWRDVLEDLKPYARDENGFMNAPGVPAPTGHRHWSHIQMIFPYYEINWDQPENRDLILKSMASWGTTRHHAWTKAVQSVIYTSMGDGEKAYAFMKGSLNSFHLTPNTMHMPGRNPCSETYGATMNMLQEMLMQSWGGRIRVFNGIPAHWKDAVFHDLRAQGAFLVSAARAGGSTRWIRVTSLAGEPCKIQADFGGVTPKVQASRAMNLTAAGDGVWSLDLGKGESAVLYAAETCPELTIAPLPLDKAEHNRYGLRAPMPVQRKKGKRRGSE